MTNTLHRLDNPVWTSLKEDIDLRRREDVDRLLLHLLSSNSHKNKKSKRAEHSHKKRRRRSMLSSSSSSASTQSENDYGRYKRVKLAPQVAETPIPLQPVEPG